jgi:hypothetical protein
MEWLDHGLEQESPVPLCEYLTKDQERLRNHWSVRHWDDTFQLDGETGYEKCERCMKYVQTRRLAIHQRTRLCHEGDLRRESRANAAVAIVPAPKFCVGDRQRSGASDEVSLLRTDTFGRRPGLVGVCSQPPTRQGKVVDRLQSSETRRGFSEIVC